MFLCLLGKIMPIKSKQPKPRPTAARSKSSKAWLQEHFNDAYVKRAQQEGVRARSVYKLREINERYKIIKTNMIVVDLGAAPGSWSEYAAKVVGARGRVFALDILPIIPLETVRQLNNITYLQGDFTKESIVTGLQRALATNAHERVVQVVLSDMAPNTTGIKDIDQARSLELVYAALNFARKTLLTGGTFLAKVFQSQDTVELIKELRRIFRDVKTVKPEASRSRSQEVFLLAQGFILE